MNDIASKKLVVWDGFKRLSVTLKDNLKNYMLIFLLLFAPAVKLVHYNHEYFTISLMELVIYVSLMAVPISGLAALLRVSGKLRPHVDTAIVFLLATSVISTFFLPVSLGVIDGVNVTSLERRTEATVFSLNMLALFVLLILLPKSSSLRPHAMKTIAALRLFSTVYVLLFAMYAAATYPNLVGLTGEQGKAPYASVSSERNVFIISFDQIQGCLLHGYLNQQPERQAALDDFVFYPDAATTYPNTNYSIASALLGRIVSDSTESMVWALDARESITATMRSNGYSVFASISTSNPSETCQSVFLNAEDTAFNYFGSYENLRHALNLAFGIDIRSIGLGFPRGLPSPVPAELVDYAWKLDLHQYQAFVASMEVSSARPTFYFVHFYATHQPFTYTSDGSLRGISEIQRRQNIDDALAQVECFVSSIERFVAKLKDLGVYDQSMIFFVSDHGYEGTINSLSHQEGGEAFFPESADATGDPRNIKPAGSYNPVLLLKDLGSTGDFTIDRSPASLIDMAPTVCASTGLECHARFEGQVLHSLTGEPRERSFWLYLGGAGESRFLGGKDRLHKGLDTWWEVRSFVGPVYPNLAIAMGLSESLSLSAPNLAALPSQVGSPCDGSIVSTGQSGYLVYGPCVSMQAGEYHLVVTGSAISTSQASVDVVSRLGKVKHAQFALSSTNAETGVLASGPVILNEDVTDLEVRVFVSADDDISLNGYELLLVRKLESQ